MAFSRESIAILMLSQTLLIIYRDVFSFLLLSPFSSVELWINIHINYVLGPRTSDVGSLYIF